MIFKFLVVVLCAVSVANIISSEYIFKWLRELVLKTEKEWLITFVHCPTCLGFWCGLFGGLFVFGLSPLIVATALISSLCGRILKMFEE